MHTCYDLVHNNYYEVKVGRTGTNDLKWSPMKFMTNQQQRKTDKTVPTQAQKERGQLYKAANSSRDTDSLHIVTIVQRSDTFIISVPNSFLTVPRDFLVLVLT